MDNNDVNEPVEPEFEGGGYSWYWVCGDCHGIIKQGEEVCHHCKRRIKWDGKRV